MCPSSASGWRSRPKFRPARLSQSVVQPGSQWLELRSWLAPPPFLRDVLLRRTVRERHRWNLSSWLALVLELAAVQLEMVELTLEMAEHCDWKAHSARVLSAVRRPIPGPRIFRNDQTKPNSERSADAPALSCLIWRNPAIAFFRSLVSTFIRGSCFCFLALRGWYHAKSHSSIFN